jgi:hypothetical protein
MKSIQHNLFFAILIMSFLNNCVRKDKSNDCNYFVSKELVQVLNEFIIDTEKKYLKYRKNPNESFYLVRFFNIDDITYLNLECTVVFPYMFFSYQKEGYVYDRSKMYFFVLNDRNVIIMDENTYDENRYFSKYNSNLKVVEVVDNYFRQRISPIMSKVSYVNIKTFIATTNENTSLVPLSDVIYSPPYPSEKELEIEEVIVE